MIRQILHTFVTRFLVALINFGITVIISNYLGAEGKGIQGIILTTVSFIVLLTNITGSGALTYLFPRFHFSLLYIPSFFWSLGLAGLLLLLRPLLQEDIEHYYIQVILISMASSLMNFNITLLYAQQKIKTANNITLLYALLLITSIVYLIVLKKRNNVESYILAMALSNGVGLVISFLPVIKQYTRTPYRFSLKKYLVSFRNLFRYGLFNQLDIIAQYLSFRISYYFISMMMGNSEVGRYSVAVSIIESLWIISRSLAIVQHTKIVNSRDKDFRVSISLSFIKASLLAIIIPMIILDFIPAEFYQRLFGKEFTAINQVLWSLSPGIVFFSISLILSSYFSGTGKHHVNTLSSISGLIATVILLFLLLPDMGIIGAGLTASVSYLITTLIKGYYFRQEKKFTLRELLPSKQDFQHLRTLNKKN